MPVQMIELEEVMMIEASDDALEAMKAVGAYTVPAQGTYCAGNPGW